jgi:hypothetical protein
MRKEMYVRPWNKNNLNFMDLMYFGLPIKPQSGAWLSAENMFPNTVNDITYFNLKQRKPMSIGCGRSPKEAYENSLERLEKRVLRGEYDCIAIVGKLIIPNGGIFYCYTDSELYKFKERNWKHPVRGD